MHYRTAIKPFKKQRHAPKPPAAPSLPASGPKEPSPRRRPMEAALDPLLEDFFAGGSGAVRPEGRRALEAFSRAFGLDS